MNTQSTIEVISRNVGFPGNSFLIFPYQHLFLVYTNEEGKKISVSAGPENKNYLTGDIDIVEIPYRENIKNEDFYQCSRNRCFTAIQIAGTEEEISVKWQQILTHIETIKKAKVDYNFPLCDGALNLLQMIGEGIDRVTEETFTTETMLQIPPVAASKKLCNTINSNTVVKELLDFAKIPFKLPVYPNEMQVDVPGIEGRFSREKLESTAANLKKSKEEAFKHAHFDPFEVMQRGQAQLKKQEQDFKEFSFDKEEMVAEIKKQQEKFKDALNFGDIAVNAQKELAKKDHKPKPSTGDYAQDAMDVAEYSRKILEGMNLPGNINDDSED